LGFSLRVAFPGFGIRFFLFVLLVVCSMLVCRGSIDWVWFVIGGILCLGLFLFGLWLWKPFICVRMHFLWVECGDCLGFFIVQVVGYML